MQLSVVKSEYVVIGQAIHSGEVSIADLMDTLDNRYSDEADDVVTCDATNTMDDAVYDDDDDDDFAGDATTKNFFSVDNDDNDIGDWLDEKSSGQIPATRGASCLCNACKHLFTKCQPFGRLDLDPSDSAPFEKSPWCRFLRESETLKRSASRGCGFCKLISAFIGRNSLQVEPAEQLGMKFRILPRKAPDGPRLEGAYKCYSRSDIDRSVSHRRYLEISSLKESRSSFESYVNYERLQHTGSANNSGTLVDNWVQRCVKEHPACNSGQISDHTLPTRLLDLGSRSEPLLIRLAETETLEKGSRYIALSHCWGGKVSFVLKNKNVDDFKQGFHISKLPLSFQNAISITYTLGVRYLWIDSLCIIQDSVSDWEREAGRMKGVYQNALLTIAATGAENSTVGLFLDRNDDLLLSVFIDISWAGIPEGTYRVFDGLAFDLWGEIAKEPLEQRAWVVQERLLSRRTVHFGKFQVAWSCQELQACETFPDKLPWNEIENSEYLGLADGLRHRRSTLPSVLWCQIVRIYCAKRLTRDADKCAAISGIAEEIHASTGDRYIAGMWQSCFVAQMSWGSDHNANKFEGIIARRPSKYRAPSWSWLSINGHISGWKQDGRVNNCKVVFDVLTVEVENTTENKFGSIRSAQLRGYGMLRSGMLKEIEGNARILILGGRPVKFDDGLFGFFDDSQFSTDVASKESYNDVWCLPLLLDHNENKSDDFDLLYFGIILVETGQRKNEYKRIGCFQLGYDSNDDYLQLLPEHRSHPQWSIVTIV